MIINKGRPVLLAVLASVLLLCACAGQRDGKSLREHGMDVVGLMEEMVKNTDYGSIMSNSKEIEELRLKAAAGEYKSPQAVYEISISNIWDAMAFDGMGDTINGLPDTLKKQLDNRSASALISILNTQNGTPAIAFSSIYTAGKTFVSSELEENTVYLYTFQNGCSIAVAFVAGEDETVTATGNFIMMDNIGEEAAGQIQEMLENIGFTDVFRILPDAS